MCWGSRIPIFIGTGFAVAKELHYSFGYETIKMEDRQGRKSGNYQGK
jgi:hypothetical protein